MKKIPFCSFVLAGVSLTDYGFKVPSPFCSLEVGQAEIDSYTSWTLTVLVGGDSKRQVNAAAFEALLYSSAQNASSYGNSAGIPVSFMLGWTDDSGNVTENCSYQGWTIQFQNAMQGQFMAYTVTGYAQLGMQMSTPVINIPALTGFVQPSAVVEALAKGIKADTYYNLDIDHCDAPTLVSHNAMTTSFTDYVRGSYSGEDDYDTFPGLLKLSASYNHTREAAGLQGLKKLSQGINNLTVTPLSKFLKSALTDSTPQCSTFSYWVDEPTMTSLGTIHYKSNAGLLSSHYMDTLEYGTANTNILSLSGSYNGVSYNISNLDLGYVGFSVDASGNSIANAKTVVNSWSSSIEDAYQASNIINDVNALATQFSGDFVVTIAGSCKSYHLAQPISLVVALGNTVSPMSGIYSIMSVTHSVSDTFITTLKLKRLVMSSANQTAASQGLLVSNESSIGAAYSKTDNVISESKVDFGEMYPTFSDMARL